MRARVQLVLMGAFALIAFAAPLWADTIPSKPVSRQLAAELAPIHAWNGCGAGVHGGLNIAEGSFGGSTIVPAANGQASGLHAVCDIQFGAGAGALVMGVEGDLDYMFGNLHTLGVDWAYAGRARVGVLMNPSTLLYGHGGYVNYQTDAAKMPMGVGRIDGWAWGAGLETKLQTNVPLFLDGRYTYNSLNTPDKWPSSIDLSGHEFRVGLTWKFQPIRQVD